MAIANPGKERIQLKLCEPLIYKHIEIIFV